MTQSSPVRSTLLALVVMLGLALVAATSASAATTYGPFGEFGDPGTGDGQMTAPRDVAVDADTGNVLVADRDNDRVQVLAPDAPLNYLTQFGVGTLDDPVGIAIDQDTGDVYVADSGNNRILKFESDGQPTPTYTVDGAFTSPPLGSAAGEIGAFDVTLAVDPSTGDLLVADRLNNRVSRYGADGTFESSFDGSAGAGSPGAFTGLLDVAVDSTGDILIVDSATGSVGDVVNGSASSVERYDASGSYEQTIGLDMPSPGAVTTDPDTDEVVVAANFQSYNNSQPLRLHLFEPDGTPAADFPLGNQTLYSVVPGLAVDGGTSGRLYAVTDMLSGYGDVTLQAFEPVPVAAPEASTEPAGPVNEITARLRGQIDPNHLETTYWFEYGPTASYGSSVPATEDATVPAGANPVEVSRSIGGLAPDTTYHYRLVASNAEGSAEGADATFTTASDALPTDPNPGAGPRPGPPGENPDDRRYELVSPVDKNYNDVAFTTGRTRASLDGDAVTFVSTGAFPGSEGMAKVAQYLSRRGQDGWSSRGLLPIGDTHEGSIAFAPSFVEFTDDLSRGILSSVGPRQPDPAAPPGTLNIYRRDNLTNVFTVLTKVAPPGADTWTDPPFAAASADLEHVTFESPGALTPDAPDDGSTKLYEYFDGELRLVGIMPDGTPAPSGAVAGPGAHIQTGLYLANTVSDDGSRVFFTAAPELDQEPKGGQLYVRENGATSTHISASQRTVPEATLPAIFRDATPDGSKVLFTSCEKLTDGATAELFGSCSGAGSADLYQYDLETGDLTLISKDEDPSDGDLADAKGVVGQSEDGSHVYFVARNSLVPESAAGSGDRLYLWHDGQIEYVAPVSGDPGLWDLRRGDRASRVSADGRRLLFASFVGGAGRQVYLYDADTREKRCLSCDVKGEPVPQLLETNGATLVHGSNSGLAAGSVAYRNRALLPDGSRAYFTSDQPLAVEDTNGRAATSYS